MAIQDIYQMLTRGAGQFIGGNPAGPIMEGVQGAIDKGRGGLQSVQDMAKLILAQKAQQAANPPDMPFDPEVMRQKLGEAPETFVAPDNKYVVGADPSNVGISAIGIALDMMLKNKTAKSQKLRDEYDKKLARIERIEDKKFEDAYMRAQPDYIEKQKMEKEDREWTQKQRERQESEWSYTDKMRAAKASGGISSGGSGVSGGGRVLAGEKPAAGTPFTKDESREYTSTNNSVMSKITADFGTPEYWKEWNNTWSAMAATNPRSKYLYEKAKSQGIGSSTGPSEEEQKRAAVEAAKTRMAQLKAGGSPPELSPNVAAPQQVPPSRGLVESVITDIFKPSIDQGTQERLMREQVEEEKRRRGIPAGTTLIDLINMRRRK